MSSQLPRYESYKKSGVEWLGKIPSHWETKRLKTVVESETNGVWGSDPKGEKDTICIRVADFDRNSLSVSLSKKTKRYITDRDFRTRQLQYDDLLLEKSGGGEKQLVGQVVRYGHNVRAVCSNFIARIRVKPNINPKFLNYVFASFYSNKIIFKHIKQTTGIQNIDSSSYFNELAVFPPLVEQIRISNFLDQKTAEIDEAITKKEQIVTLLQEQKAVLINQAVTKGLNPKALMKDSGVEWLGEIPAHWEMKKNKTLFEERKIPGKEELPILTVSLHTGVSEEEQSGEINLRAKVRIEDKSSYKLVKKGYIAFNMMRAWQGSIGVVKTEGMVSPAYIVAEPMGEINGEYFEYLYRTAAFIAEMDRFSKGITDFRKRLYWDEFKQLLTILPPQNEQLAIAKHVKELNSSCDRLSTHINHEIEKLGEYRSVLISNTVTGQIRI